MSTAPASTNKQPRRRRSPLPWVALALTFGAFVGTGAYTFTYAEGTSYLSNDPKACVNCHIMREQYDGWQKSTHHAAATCNDCHVPHDSLLAKYMAKADHGYRHSKAFTLQNFHEPIRITEPDRKMVLENCVRCHSDLIHDISVSAANNDSGGAVDCIHCHSHVGHGAVR